MRRQRFHLAVHRLEDSVYYRRIARETFLLLNALRSDATVAEAVTEAFEETKLKAKEQAELIRESFAHASELGWLCPRVENGENVGSGGGRTIGRLQSGSHISADDVKSCNSFPGLSVR
jgi:hypothetical protein